MEEDKMGRFTLISSF